MSEAEGIFKEYEEFVSGFSDEKSSEISEIAVKEFGSIENIAQVNASGTEAVHIISRNCIKLCSALLKEERERKEREARAEEERRAALLASNQADLIKLSTEEQEILEEALKRDGKTKRTFVSGYIPVLESKSGISPRNKGKKSPSANPHAKTVALAGNQKGYVVQVYSPYTKKRSEYFDPYLQYGGESMYGAYNHL